MISSADGFVGEADIDRLRRRNQTYALEFTPRSGARSAPQTEFIAGEIKALHWLQPLEMVVFLAHLRYAFSQFDWTIPTQACDGMVAEKVQRGA